MKTKLMLLVSGLTAVLFLLLPSAFAQVWQPPYTNVTVDHSITGGSTTSILADNLYCSRYDTNGLVDGSSGTLYHNSVAFSGGIWGGAHAEVFDRMSIPFTVSQSDFYTVNISGNANVGRYSVGEKIDILGDLVGVVGISSFGSDWGDFEIVIQPMFILDKTSGQIVYAEASTSIDNESHSIFQSIEPIVYQLVEDDAKVLAANVGASQYTTIGLKVADMIRKLGSLSDAVKGFLVHFDESATVHLTAGHQYCIQPLLASRSAAASELVGLGYGGHFSCVDGVLQVTNISVVSTTPKYSLTVQSSGISGVNVGVTPADINGYSSGGTPINLNYAPGANVTLTALNSVGSQTFSTWAGVDSQSGNVAHVTMNGNRTATAIYSSPPSTITVTAPNGGGVYQRARNLYINWTSTGNAGQYVNIDLLKSGVLNTSIATSVNNAGVYTWSIPSGQTVGTDYRVRVSSTSTGASGQSASNFQITTNSPIPSTIYISSLSDLQSMSDNWGDSQHPVYGTYILTSDIDAKTTSSWNGGLGFKPIGSGNNYFRGTFDGQGHKITRLYCNRPSEAYAAFFAVTSDSAVIKNLNLEPSVYEAQGGVNRSGSFYGGVGGIVGENSGLIQNCQVTLNSSYAMYVTNGSYCGGLVGANYRGIILNCSVIGNGDVSARGTTGGTVGGIAGFNDGLIRWCSVGSNVTLHCYTSAIGQNTGGIAGDNESGGQVIECEALANYISGNKYYVGGVVGENYGGVISDCYFLNGSIKGSGQLGGVAGDDSGGSIFRCYARAGSFSTGNSASTGVLVGDGTGIIQDCYWSTDASSRPGISTYFSGTVSNCVGKTDLLLQQQATFFPWDFTNVWSIAEGTDFPRLLGIGTQLATPSNVTASTGLNYGVQISWSLVSNATFYGVFRSESLDGAKTALSTNWLTLTNFVDTTAQPLSTYFYWVKAGTTPGGGRSSEFSLPATGSAALPPFDAPQDVAASDGLPNQVLVTWSSVTNAGCYQVFRSLTLGGVKTNLTGWQTNTFLFDLAGVQDTTYYYWVKAAANSGGDRASDYSASDQGFFYVPCVFSLSATNWNVPAGGGSTNIVVTTPGVCKWSVVNPYAGIITSTNGGSGSATITVTALPNTTGSTQYYALTIAENNYLVTQPPCSFAISPTSTNLSTLATNGSFQVTTTGGCPWSAITNNSWIAITAGSSGTSTGTVAYAVLANPNYNSRTGTVSVADQIFTIVQAGDTVRPTNTITSPTNGQNWSNIVFTVTGKASDNVAVSNVFYSLNNASWMTATPVSNWSNWTAAVNLIAGTNSIQAYAVDTGGNKSPTNSVSLNAVLSTVLTVSTNGLGSLNPNYNNALLQVGKSYSITATPGTGFRFTNWTGGISLPLAALTNGVTLQFVMQSNLVLQANFVDTNRPALSITNLTAGQRWSNLVFTARGTATDNWQVASVQVQLNGGIWTNATGTTNWSAPLTLTPGTNTLAVFATDTTGNNSPTNSVIWQYVVTNLLTVQATGLGTISPNYSNSWLEIGRNYSMTATPASGFVVTNWTISTNWLGGRITNNATVQFMMASNLTLQVNFADVTKPTLTITAPTAGQKMTNALATFVGTASDNWKVAGVWYQLNSNTWNLVTATTNNYTNWTQTLPLVIGTNTLKAYALDLGGNFSTTNTLSVVSSNTFMLQLAFTNSLPMTTNGLVFSLQLSKGLNGHIQVSTNLTSWLTLTNFVGSNASITFRDQAATNSARRFYRAVIP